MCHQAAPDAARSSRARSGTLRSPWCSDVDRSRCVGMVAVGDETKVPTTATCRPGSSTRRSSPSSLSIDDVGADGPNPTVLDPESGAAEAYHFAVSSLGFALDQIDGTRVVVTSASPGDGKSVTALNIAIAAAQDGRRPLLIDADERARGLTRLSVLGIDWDSRDLRQRQPGRPIVVGDWQCRTGRSLPFVAAGKQARRKHCWILPLQPHSVTALPQSRVGLRPHRHRFAAGHVRR